MKTPTIRLKDKETISRLRKCGQKLAYVLDELRNHVSPGVSTLELNNIAMRVIRSLRAKPAFLNYRGFPAALCASVNDEVVHGIPKASKILRVGDVLGLDCGLVDNGVFTDMAVTVIVGKGPKKIIHFINRVQKACSLGIAQAIPGNHIGDIGAAIQTYCESFGYGVIRDLVGHGVGYDIHEPPQVPNFGRPGTGIELVPGMVLAIEPMMSMGRPQVVIQPDHWTVRMADHSLSCHFEHTIVILESGPEILTKQS